MKISELTKIEIVVGLVAAYGIYRMFHNGMLNPASPENVVNQAVTNIGAQLSGDKDFSLGTWLYNVTHPDEVESMDRDYRKAVADAKAMKERATAKSPYDSFIADLQQNVGLIP